MGRVAATSRRGASSRSPRGAPSGPSRTAPRLLELGLQDFVIVSEARFRLARGLNVLTGETGTGKSILLDAVLLLLGGRGSAALLRRGADRLRVEGVFELGSDTVARSLLDGWGVAVENDRLVVTREIRRDGSNRCLANGRTVLVSQLAELGAGLAEIHGPLECQMLLKQEALREHIDLFGGHDEELRAVAKAHAEWTEAGETLRALEARLARVAEQEDFLRFQLDEIRDVPLGADERDTRQREVAELESARREGEALSFLEAGLDSAEGSVLETVESLEDGMSKLDGASAEVAAIARRLRALRDEVRSLAREVRRAAAGRERDASAEIEALQETLARVERLERKHRAPWNEVLEKAGSLENDLALLDDGRNRIEELRRTASAASRTHHEACRALHEKRSLAARRMVRELEPHLRDVGWNPKGLRIDVRWMGGDEAPDPEEGPGARDGRDEIVWDVETNPGEGWRPLHRVVSHGELSRLNLALLSLQMDRARPLISLFDEVDTGIGGATSRRVADKIEELARRRQVLLVTHLATMASKAEAHLRVVKRERRGRTEALIDPLGGEERVQEIARMLAGTQTNEKALEHARELLQGSRS